MSRSQISEVSGEINYRRNYCVDLLNWNSRVGTLNGVRLLGQFTITMIVLALILTPDILRYRMKL